MKYLLIIFLLLAPFQSFAATDVTMASGNAVRAPWVGFGVNWQTFAYDSSSPSATNWTNTYVPRLQWMRPGIVRLMMSVTYPGYPSAPDWNSASMVQLYRVLDYCQANNIPVFLEEWGNGWLQPSGWLIGDTIYINAIGAYMQQLITMKEYTCIKYFSIANEPNYDSGVASESYYFTAFNAIKTKLFTTLGLSGFTMIGPDEGASESVSSAPWTTTAAASYASSLAGYDFHRYTNVSDFASGGMTTGLNTIFDSIISSDSGNAGKVFALGESGMKDGASTNGNTNIATFNYGLWMADYGVQGARARAGALAAWSIDDDGVTQTWGMWDTQGNGYALRPWFYTWSLMSRLFPASSTIYAPTNPNTSVRVLGAKTPTGKWSFVGVNESGSSIDLNFIATSEATTTQLFSRYLYSSGSQTVDGNGIPTAVSTVSTAPASGITVTVPAASVVVLSSADNSDPNINLASMALALNLHNPATSYISQGNSLVISSQRN